MSHRVPLFFFFFKLKIRRYYGIRVSGRILLCLCVPPYQDGQALIFVPCFLAGNHIACSAAVPEMRRAPIPPQQGVTTMLQSVGYEPTTPGAAWGDQEVMCWEGCYKPRPVELQPAEASACNEDARCCKMPTCCEGYCKCDARNDARGC